jgi:hypothetical protein
MPHARFVAALLGLSTAATVLLGGPSATGERQAIGAPRRTVKPPRRTASASVDPTVPVTSTDATAPAIGADSTAPSSSPRNASPRTDGGSARGARVRHSRDGAETKAPRGSAAGANGATEAARPISDSARSAIDGPSKKVDAHLSAAKSPGDASNLKSTAEKFAPEASANPAGGNDAADPSRASADMDAPSIRRDSTTDARRESAPSSAFQVSPSALSIARPVVISLEGPVFDGGDVPKAAAALERMKSALGRCVAAENALTRNEASVDLRFLVRAPGRAEGVGAEKARGVSGDVVRCMTSVLARSYVGAPSDDPVGVAVTVRMKRAEAANN